MSKIKSTVAVVSLSLLGGVQALLGQANGGRSTPTQTYEVDAFQAYEDGGLPTRWKYLDEGVLVPVAARHMRPRERFYVVAEGNEKLLRVYSEGEAVHLEMPVGPEGIVWNLNHNPIIRWRWRAHQLPEGAQEDRQQRNDSGIALYVIFAMDGFIVKRPRIIKYVYSSTLPVGTVVTYGRLKVVVVSSAKDGLGNWQTITRNVVADHKRVFGQDPPDEPLSIRLWSDTDNTQGIAMADIDDIVLLPASK